MKRFIVVMALGLVFVIVALVIALQWPVVFWLLVLSACLYFAFGRRAEVEFRLGVGGDSSERRFYTAVVWKQAGKTANEAETSGLDTVKLEDRV